MPPPTFEELCHQTSSLVVGPRGSGKTTLLKMLHPLALENWNHPDSHSYRNKINFTGVFIPYDRNWNDQIDSLGQGKLDCDSQMCFKRCAFTTHILHSLVESILCRVGKAVPSVVRAHRRAVLSADDERYPPCQ